jgi:site-specific DNA recombinase
MPKVTMIPATVNPLTHMPSASARKRRVAGYSFTPKDTKETQHRDPKTSVRNLLLI